ncbi:MAG: 30S ribosomal protein S17 [Microgenomates group bacterium]|jgi:small subunit ribosomal protein S17
MPKKVKKEEMKTEEKETMKKHQQVFRGRVVSAKTKQTATVLLESRKTHPLYKKSYAQSKKFLVHDELGVKAGDIVEIVKCRPISKNKHFTILKVVGRDIEAIVTEKINEDVKKAIEEVIPEKSEDQNIGESAEQKTSVPTSRKTDKPKKETK